MRSMFGKVTEVKCVHTTGSHLQRQVTCLR